MKRLTLFIVTVMLVFSLACSAFGGRKKAEPEPTLTPAAPTTQQEQEPATAPTATPAEPAEETPDPQEPEQDAGKQGAGQDDADFYVDASAYEALSSYRSELVMTFTSEDGSTQGGMTLVQEATTNPPARHVLMDMTGTFPGSAEVTEMADGDAFEVEIFIVEEKQWIRFGDMWLQSGAEADDTLDSDFLSSINESFIDPDNLNALAEEKGVAYVGREEVNGIQADHYRAQHQSLWGNLGLRSEDIESGEADVWIAAEPDLPKFVVRMTFEITGKLDMEEGASGEEGQEVAGTMIFDMEVTDINQPITIEVPEDAGAGGMPEDVPAYPNAQDQNAFGGMITVTTEDDEETVTEFYNTALEEAGWTFKETGFLGSTWEKEGRELSLVVTYDEEEQITSIVIMINEQED